MGLIMSDAGLIKMPKQDDNKEISLKDNDIVNFCGYKLIIGNEYDHMSFNDEYGEYSSCAFTGVIYQAVNKELYAEFKGVNQTFLLVKDDLAGLTVSGSVDIKVKEMSLTDKLREAKGIWEITKKELEEEVYQKAKDLYDELSTSLINNLKNGYYHSGYAYVYNDRMKKIMIEMAKSDGVSVVENEYDYGISLKVNINDL